MSAGGAAIAVRREETITPTSGLLEEAELQELFDRHNIPELGRQRIRQVREELPARATRSGKLSGKLRIPSKKMGFALEAEAFATEAVAMFEWEYDEEVREYYSQPACRLKINFRNKGGRPTAAHITTDSFRIIPRRGFVFTECKTEEDLVRLSQETPDRYTLDRGRWRSPPAERAAAELGCEFEIRSTKQNNYALVENLGILRDYLNHDKGLQPLAQAHEIFEKKVSLKQYASAYELIHLAPNLSADDLYVMLINRQIFFPLLDLRLADQDSALFFRSEHVWRAHELFRLSDRPERRAKVQAPDLKIGDAFEWNGVQFEILNIGTRISARRYASGGSGATDIITLTANEFNKLQDTEIRVHDTSERIRRTNDAEVLLAAADQHDLQEACYRYQILFPDGDNEKKNPLSERKKRARFYWLKSFRQAEELYGNGFVGLLARRHGNRDPKVHPRSRELANEAIRNDWETTRHKTRRLVHGAYVNRCKVEGVDPLSYAMLCTYIKARAGHQQKALREGEKAAYDLAPQYLTLERTTARHGTHSWHIGHIDHTPLPLQFVGAEFSGLADTVWLTVLTTAFDRKVRASYLSFDEPSYRSCMMVLRDCVRRNGRLPQMIVSDQGPEFNGVYYETLLAFMDVIKRERPGGKAKFGSVCERMWFTTQTQFVATLLGATDLVEKNFRAISPEADPKRQARWILEQFEENLDRFFETIYHKAHHSGIDMTPDAAERLSLKSHGDRAFKITRYDEQFIARTSPAVKRDKVTVRPAGVKINYRWFNGDVLNQPGVLGLSVPARYDPWNVGRAFVYLNKKWIEVHSELYAVYKNRTERELRFVTEAYKLLARSRNQKAVIDSANLATFLMSTEGVEAGAKQARNDHEISGHRQKNMEPHSQPESLEPDAPASTCDVPIWKREVTSINVVPIRKPSIREIKILEDL